MVPGANSLEHTGSTDPDACGSLTPSFFSDECFVIDNGRIDDIQAAVDAGEISPEAAEQAALGWEDRF